MCIKCEIKKVIVGGLFGAEIKEVEVGKISEAARLELKQLQDAREKLDHEVEVATKKAAEALEEQFKEKQDGLKNLFNAAWKDAVTSAGIDLEKQAADYSINKHTGVVTVTKVEMADKKEQPETAQGVH
ncbi:hypothetical protein ACF5W4_11315 [Bacillota bacterium Lsc_1132]